MSVDVNLHGLPGEPLIREGISTASCGASPATRIHSTTRWFGSW